VFDWGAVTVGLENAISVGELETNGFVWKLEEEGLETNRFENAASVPNVLNETELVGAVVTDGFEKATSTPYVIEGPILLTDVVNGGFTTEGFETATSVNDPDDGAAEKRGFPIGELETWIPCWLKDGVEKAGFELKPGPVMTEGFG